MTCLHYWSSQSEHQGMTIWLNYIIYTSWNKHGVTIHKIHRWIHSKVTNTTTIVRALPCKYYVPWFLLCYCVLYLFSFLLQICISYAKIPIKWYSRGVRKSKEIHSSDIQREEVHVVEEGEYIENEILPWFYPLYVFDPLGEDKAITWCWNPTRGRMKSHNKRVWKLYLGSILEEATLGHRYLEGKPHFYYVWVDWCGWRTFTQIRRAQVDACKTSQNNGSLVIYQMTIPC